MLENPTHSGINLMITFYSLLQGGFLTEDNKGRGYFKIPNKEIRSEFENKLRRHLNSLPFRGQSIPKLFTATKSEDFQTLGEEMTKSLYSLYLALKNDKERSVERSIHNLMLGYLERLTRNGDYVVLHEHREDPSGDNRELSRSCKYDEEDLIRKSFSVKSRYSRLHFWYQKDFHLVPGTEGHKTHYILEVKNKFDRKESISETALKSLRQIYDLNYHRNLMKSDEATPVIMMGLAARHNQVCLVTQKVEISKGKIEGAETIKHQLFLIDGNCNDKIKVKCTDPVEHKLDLSSLDMHSQQETTDDEIDEQRKRDINESISVEITELIKRYLESEKGENQKM
jgi:hypothetical protein